MKRKYKWRIINSDGQLYKTDYPTKLQAEKAARGFCEQSASAKQNRVFMVVRLESKFISRIPDPVFTVEHKDV